MMSKEYEKEALNELVSGGSSLPIKSDSSRASTASQLSDGDLGLPACRVCQCVESDERGDAVLGFLGIIPCTPESDNTKEQLESDSQMAPKNVEGSASLETNHKGVPGFVRFVSPDGEVVVCHTDLEMGTSHGRDALIELGCACKNELALVHYACALKWFVNHGSTICEICGCVATNIRNADFRKVLASLKDYEALRERTANGVPNPARVCDTSGVDPDAIAARCDTSGVDPDAIAANRRQRLSEIYLWFNPHCQNHYCNKNDGNIAAASLVVGEAEQSSNVVVEDVTHPENPATKWAVEGAGILVATVLLTVILAWLIAHVGKKTAKNGLHILLGAVCALAVVIFFRFVSICPPLVLTKAIGNPYSEKFEVLQ